MTAVLSCVTSEGGLLHPELLQRILAQDPKLAGLTPGDFHETVRLGEAASRAWSALQPVWRAFRFKLDRLPAAEAATALTRDGWLLPLFRELGYGMLAAAGDRFRVDETPVAITHGYGHAPIHLLGARVSIDRRPPATPQPKGAPPVVRTSPHGLVQDLLNRSDDHLWGIVSNGLVLRLLRDHQSLSSAAYVELDLEQMFDGGLYGEFALLFALCHQSRLEAPKPEETWLERWFRTGQEEGVRALDRLRGGVEEALTELGAGFLRHPENVALREALSHGWLSKQDYFRQLLRLLYRVLFVFVAEDRDALLPEATPPEVRERYRRHYSTDRLRALAARSRGGAHGDLWVQLRLVLDGLWEGEPALGLPALGSGLFDPEEVPHLRAASLSNRHLLAAIRALSEVREGKRSLRVSYRNLGAQELGSVYESLLELHPAMHVDAGTFELASAAGHERKTTGSYYTPASLVDCLLDTALDPVVDAAVSGKSGADAEEALLALRVVDPACGSGHFLVAAARRMAERLARIRHPDEEPSPRDRQHAMRDVVGRCLFGVDVNPMAVELCKVSLWIEALEPGRPLSFLDAHIQHGNALLGATPALLARGIPDEAFEPIEGDDKKTASALKKQNKKERADLSIDFSAPPPSTWVRLSEVARLVDAATDETLAAVRAKEAQYDELVGSTAFDSARFLADLWCSAFVWRKEATQRGEFSDARERYPTEATYRRLVKDPRGASDALRDEVRRLRNEYQFFHWHLAFPQVLRPKQVVEESDPCGWDGGFDVVLGNPPWETLSPDVKEFFAAYDATIRSASPKTQASVVERLLRHDPIRGSWEQHRRALFGGVHFMKNSGRYLLFAEGNLGKGDFNTYRFFVELALRHVCDGGVAAQLVPENIYNGANAQAIRSYLFTKTEVLALVGFENHQQRWFSNVHSAMKFALYSCRPRVGATDVIPAMFNVRGDRELASWPAGAVRLPVDMVREFSPDALAVMEIASQRDVDLVRAIYARWPKLGDDKFPGPRRSYMAEVHMGNDRELFRERGDVPVYEGRMVEAFDHRAKGYRSGRGREAVWEELPFGSAKAIEPQWYIDQSAVPEKLRDRVAKYRVAFCDVTSPTNERSLVAAMLPPNVLAGHTAPTVTFESGGVIALLGWLAIANSFVVDFVVRMKVSLHVSFTILDSLPFPRGETALEHLRLLARLAAELTCIGPEMTELADSVEAELKARPKGEVDETNRSRIRAEIDALVARCVYGLSREDVDWVMSTFPIVKRRDEEAHGYYRTKALILERYDAMAEAAAKGTTYQTVLDPPPADPRVAHPPRRAPT